MVTDVARQQVNKQIHAEKITKPIQLLGAWLVGLLAVDAAFLAAATHLGAATWQSGALVIAAILNVPVFIGALFVLQTKFRPELQEDSFYSTYLNSRTNQVEQISKKDAVIEAFEDAVKRLSVREVQAVEAHSEFSLADLSFGVNVHLKNQTEIEEALHSAGVPVIREFGQGADAPMQTKVAVAAHLPAAAKKAVFAFASKLGIQYYGIIEPWEEVDEDVLIGAYGETKGKIVSFS